MDSEYADGCGKFRTELRLPEAIDLEERLAEISEFKGVIRIGSLGRGDDN
jgi:hypothetical protein